MNLAYNLQLFKEIFFPRRCSVCACEIDSGIVCSACRANFSLDKIKNYGANRDSWTTLTNKGYPVAAEDIFDRIELIYRYDMVFKEALHSLKFERAKALLWPLQEEAEIALAVRLASLAKHYDIVTCIPTSQERRAQRGFDVPWEIFKIFSKYPKLKYTYRIIYRVKNTAPLFSMAAEARREELVGCFALYKDVNIIGKRILLCDDIYTTGSTMQEAAQLLLRLGAQSVGVLAFAASKDNWD